MEMNIAQPIKKRTGEPQAVRVGEAIRDDVLGMLVSVGAILGLMFMAMEFIR
jgi:hypothetical protein